MGLDVYFRRDIANVLRATACASEGAMGLALELVEGVDPEKLLEVYRQGQRHALVSVGLAFGLEPVGSVVQVEQVNQGQVALLWAETPHER